MADISALRHIGLHHPEVKQYLALKNANRNAPDNLVAIEGMRDIVLAEQVGLQFHCFFLCPEMLRGEQGEQVATMLVDRGIPTYIVSKKVLLAMVEWQGPDGLAAIVQLRAYGWQDIKLRARNTILVLDRLQTPGNIGNIIRSADGAGADAIIITDQQCRLSHPGLLRASKGSLFSYPVITAEASDAIAWLRRQQFRIITTSPAATTHYRHVEYHQRIAIILGNEHAGLGQNWFAVQDVGVYIPMHGQADSLNVSNAAVLMLYEVLHQQRSVSSHTEIET